MSYNESYEHIPKEEFAFVQMDEKIYDKELATKPVGFLQDAMIRFAHNKGAVVCSAILLVMILFAVFTPFISDYQISEKDGYYSYALPRLSSKLSFWNGCSKRQVNQQTYDYYSAIPGAIAGDYGTEEINVANRVQTVYNISVDSYAKVGYVTMLLTKSEYEAVLAYQESTGVQLLYPMINDSLVKCKAYQNDPNVWYLTNAKGVAERDKNGELQNIYLKDESTEDGYAYYVSKMNGAQFYRFKGQEYVMASRTLGAKDRRLIFKHILPNASGFIITASVLTIPYTIFSEATYSYLGIVNLNSKNLTSLGSMLENGQQTLSNYPHCVFFPAVFLSLLLICFNIFGNGLRDAFNPSLRGADE